MYGWTTYVFTFPKGTRRLEIDFARARGTIIEDIPDWCGLRVVEKRRFEREDNPTSVSYRALDGGGQIIYMGVSHPTGPRLTEPIIKIGNEAG